MGELQQMYSTSYNYLEITNFIKMSAADKSLAFSYIPVYYCFAC